MSEKRLFRRWIELPFLYKIQLCAFLLAGICGAIAYPLTTKLIYSSVNVEVLAGRMVLSSIIGISLSVAWLTIQERLYSYFVPLTLIECFSYIGLVTYVIVYQDYNSYLILSTLISGTIGHLVTGAHSKLHQQITDVEQYRTDYGFFIEIVASVGVLVGSGIAVWFDITMPVAFITLLISLIGFEMVDIYIYKKMKKQTK